MENRALNRALRIRQLQARRVSSAAEHSQTFSLTSICVSVPVQAFTFESNSKELGDGDAIQLQKPREEAKIHWIALASVSSSVVPYTLCWKIRKCTSLQDCFEQQVWALYSELLTLAEYVTHLLHFFLQVWGVVSRVGMLLEVWDLEQTPAICHLLPLLDNLVVLKDARKLLQSLHKLRVFCTVKAMNLRHFCKRVRRISETA